MTIFSRCQKYITAGISGCGGALILYYGISYTNNNRTAHASSIANLAPSTKWDYNWDRREPTSLVRPSKGSGDDNRYNEETEKMKPKAVRHIFLIRHGQYNINGISDKDRILTKLGQEQAMWTGQRLNDLPFNFSKITVSTLTRAKETASIIKKCLPPLDSTECPLLAEGAPVAPEPPVAHWKPEVYEFYEDGPRIEAAFRKYFHRAHLCQETDSYEIIVCHANVIRYFVCRALQFSSNGWLRMGLQHASITWLSIMPNGLVKMTTYGDSGHMPISALTS